MTSIWDNLNNDIYLEFTGKDCIPYKQKHKFDTHMINEMIKIIKGKSSNDYNYETGAELVFTGLGSTSSPLKDKIENKILGYAANLR